MKNINLALVAVLVGALGLAPTELLPAQAATTAITSGSVLDVTTKQFGAVAGSSPAATAASSYALPAFTSGCSFSMNTLGSTSSGSTTITMTSVTGYVVGMTVSATGIPANSRINSIKATAPRNIVISLATTATIGNGTAIVATGCWQKFFSVNNIRNTNLNSFGIQQIFSSISPNTIALQSCSGTWTEATGACSGAITTIVTGSSTSAITTVLIALVASTGTVRLRALASRSGVTATISISARRATDVAAGVTTNS